jgi:hypothetical protein
VYIDALEIYDDVLVGLSPLIESAIATLGDGAPAGTLLVANTLPWERKVLHCIEEMAATSQRFQISQPTFDGKLLVLMQLQPGVISADAAAALAAKSAPAPAPATATTQADGTVVLENGIIRAVVGPGGLLSSLVHLARYIAALPH